jgi:uncharacterized membrane protein SpoIIM required for sporulation
VKIIVGLIPVLVIAGFFEGFVTRHYKMPVVLNILFLLACGAFVLFYFLYYPIHLKRKGTSAHA